MRRWPELATMAGGLATALYFSFAFKVRVADVAGEATSDDRALGRVWAIYLAVAVLFVGIVLWTARSPYADARKRTRRLWFATVGSVIGTLALGSVLTVADTARAVAESGFTAEVAKRSYEGDAEANLQALYVAAKLFHDSEDRFPRADAWMDELESRIRTNDLAEDEAAKKLINPDLAKAGGEFGFAMNDAAGDRFVEDLPADTVLFFESRSLARNAHGDPTKDARVPPRPGGSLGITVQGKAVRL